MHAIQPPGRAIPVAALALALSLTASAQTHAHLSLIRLGKESAGAREAEASFGGALAAGDFDGDGFDDLATGAPTHRQDSPLPSATVGAVVVNLGSTYGLTHEGALALQFSSTDTNQRFGAALAAGDFDGNGRDDLAVGAPQKDEASAVDAGQVFVYTGNGVGIDVLPSLAIDASALALTPATGNGFGTALVTGYFDDDDFADLAIGIPGANGGAGMVVVLYGSPAGLTTVGADIFTSVDLGVSDPGGALGAALAAGDVVGDAHDDLVIGAPNGMVTGIPGAGRVFVIHGSPSGLLNIFPLRLDDPHFGLVPTPGAEFGAALAVGNFNDAGGVNDLAIGSPGFAGDAGRVLVTHPNTLQDGADQFFVFDKSDAGSVSAPDSRFGGALAAGDIDLDGDDELAVGSPLQTTMSFEDAGFVDLFLRDDTNILDANGNLWAAPLNAEAQADGRLGTAVCFGAFDGTNQDNVIVGSPGADYKRWKKMGQLGFSTLEGSGQVHVYAPWRQTLSMKGRSGAAVNCQGELVFSQRPFDELAIASTTKAMTLLLAAEEIEAGLVDETDTITISGDKTWVVDCGIGSGGVLNAGETISLESLMELALCISSGQATYLIASLLTGGVDPFPASCPQPDENVERDCDPGFPIVQPTFIARMNDKRGDLGMFDSFFTNPHGSRSGSCLGGERHHSTAYDMALLSQAVMDNAYLAEFLDQVEIEIVREGGPWDCEYGFLTNLKSMTNDRAIGIKPGGSGYAKETGIAALRPETTMVDPVVATYFGGETDALVDARLSNMMLRADGQCAGPGPGDVLPPIDPDPTPFLIVPNIPAETGSETHRTLYALATDFAPAVEIDLQRLGNPPADTAEVRICFGLTSERELGPGETATLGVAPFTAHEGFRIRQISGTSGTYQLTISDPPSSETIVLLPGEVYDVPPYSAPGSASFTLGLQNLSSVGSSSFVVEEVSYCYDVVLSSVPGGGPGAFHAVLQHDHGASPNESLLRLSLDAFAGAAGEQLILTAHAPGVVVGVDEEAVTVAPPGLRARQYPNPMRTRATIEYALNGASPVNVAVFDAQGRRVRLLNRDAFRAPGTHRIGWDGRDETGAPVAAGVYWWRVETTEGTAVGRTVLMR